MLFTFIVKLDLKGLGYALRELFFNEAELSILLMLN